MLVTNYYSANGVIIAEHTTGQSRLDYVTDALGSVVATIDQTLTVQSTARYKPYGATLAQTGTQPIFGWVGKLGYRSTSRQHADFYIRARTYGSVEGRWLSLDPLWPSEDPYGYARANSICATDPLGLQMNISEYQRGWSNWFGDTCARLMQSCDIAGQKFNNFLGRACFEAIGAFDAYGAYAEEAQGIHMDQCHECGKSIAESWFFTLQHWDNHEYAHCMACCVLTRYYGKTCAIQEQKTQNSTWPFAKGDTVAAGRMEGCLKGVTVGQGAGGSCDSGCRQAAKYHGPALPPPNPWSPCTGTLGRNAF